jgi:hypothetical protein
MRAIQYNSNQPTTTSPSFHPYGRGTGKVTDFQQTPSDSVHVTFFKNCVRPREMKRDNHRSIRYEVISCV